MVRAFSKITLVIGAYEERIEESLGFSHRARWPKPCKSVGGAPERSGKEGCR